MTEPLSGLFSEAVGGGVGSGEFGTPVKKISVSATFVFYLVSEKLPAIQIICTWLVIPAPGTGTWPVKW